MKNESIDEIPEWELSVMDVFVRGAAMLGIRKSIGMVYAALYCSREPRNIASLRSRLHLSHGAVVEAIQFLRRLGAIRVQLKIGDRCDYFSAETDLKSFILGFLREILSPAVEKAGLRLDQAKLASDVHLLPEEEMDFARSRLAELDIWRSRLSEFLPLIESALKN